MQIKRNMIMYFTIAKENTFFFLIFFYFFYFVNFSKTNN